MANRPMTPGAADAQAKAQGFTNFAQMQNFYAHRQAVAQMPQQEATPEQAAPVSTAPNPALAQFSLIDAVSRAYKKATGQ